jgi:prephenate dehydrogenase
MGAQPYPIASDEHDRVVALTSHLPQLLSVALGSLLAPRLADEEVLALCGSGMRSMLRLGASSWPMWQAILAANGRAVAREVRSLQAALGEVADALEADRFASLAATFGEAASAVARLGANDVPASVVDTPEPVSDER